MQQTYSIVNAYPSFNEILCSNIDYSAANGFGRVETQRMIFISFPWIEYSLSINSPFINGTRNCYIYKFAAFVLHKSFKTFASHKQ